MLRVSEQDWNLASLLPETELWTPGYTAPLSGGNKSFPDREKDRCKQQHQREVVGPFVSLNQWGTLDQLTAEPEGLTGTEKS